ncbi:hypothetical protein ONZ43_g1392 [Nemania bipapillata]|uniref:Uncharacterized protein n=1 Tax=Nemania bipapillata TaxID=110536 RepID=A0ACC2J4K0_9PEZI|nr:hypothetical protein ONZ43_g1392 [Nemania bipapillata]
MIPTAKDMLSSLLRPKPTVRRVDSHLLSSHPETPSPGPANREYLERRHATADFTEGDDDDEEEEEQEEEEHDNGNEFDPNHPSIRFADQGNTFRRNPNPVIPLFSASHLGLYSNHALPVYNVVHAIRIIVQTRTETSLSWEQLRSPQVSQFLVKPMQQQIRTQHFSRATLYALMANCLQFGKEGQLYPGNASVSTTRAKVCELLALKLLKEYSTRELIDALSYDFDPLQGSVPKPPTPKGRAPGSGGRTPFARSSTLEVAIRASAKHFVSHPLVVQQLEAIWNGAITFYSSHDNLHRIPVRPQGAMTSDQRGNVDARTPLLGRQFLKEQASQLPVHEIPVRRTVALYDPRHASPLKLSRLRVPRYRYFLSTCSLFVMICLFLAVLIERSSVITSLELLFWFWSAGFMLDEVVGFNEQGFSLYVMSYWNIVDLGILLLLTIYYGMRLCGVFLVDSVQWNEMAYEVLAANAILLLPRIFSVLDHYPYFSQLLIAFRFMAEDLMALFVVILISCSGFFAFFTLTKNEDSATDVAYKIFQILMGFTPAAWDVWPKYSFIERLLLVFFLVICHFLIATILITVLTNSFTAIASNAREEHHDPADLMSNNGFPPSMANVVDAQTAEHDPKDFTDADGDDELVTNDEDYEDEVADESRQENTSHAGREEDYFTTPITSRRQSVVPSSIDSVDHPTATLSPGIGSAKRRQGLHSRTLSTNTILGRGGTAISTENGSNDYNDGTIYIYWYTLASKINAAWNRKHDTATTHTQIDTQPNRPINDRPTSTAAKTTILGQLRYHGTLIRR